LLETSILFRVLVQHLPQCSGQSNLVMWHIPSEHSKEMSQPSKVVSTFVLDTTWSDSQGWKQIKGNLWYSWCVCPHAELVDIDGEVFLLTSQRLLFGYQVTVARIRGALVLRSTHFTAADSLQGFVPVVADWHARLCFVTVCNLFIIVFNLHVFKFIVDFFNRLYSTSSSNDWGTLFQLKQLVDRTSFGKEPNHNMKATEDFLCVVLLI